MLLSWRVGLLLTLGALGGCGGAEQEPRAFTGVGDPGPVHVHGLGVNPADGALFIATHTGLFRAAEGEATARRVGDELQDTMGFTVVGPDRFLGSGHPDLRSEQPPYLGLIESGDAGRSWTPRSLLGEADFHVLEAQDDRVVGYGSDFRTRRQQLLVSDDGGRSWSARRPPAPLLDIAVSPADPSVWVASGERGLFGTADAGRSWTPLGGPGGLLGWAGRRLFRVAGDGRVSLSTSGGRRWLPRGTVGGAPAAAEAERDALYVALHDGVIKRSTDGGRTWTIRSRPAGS